MTVRRMMGTETEYAVSCVGAPRFDPVGWSFSVVRGASDPATSHIRWDYRAEDPVNDARGHRLPRSMARADMLTDEPRSVMVNTVVPNGGRVYVDHAHPEYSAPETRDPFEAVVFDHAGDAIMHDAAAEAGRTVGRPMRLHRNNIDGKGASWGTHENYLMPRSVPFDHVVPLMTVHLVSRQIFVGSGRAGLGERSEGAGYQLSQRSDYIHTRIGLQTTFDRPIINTRDESHSTDDWRRLHVIVGDANRMDVPQALKLGTTSLVLWMVENGSSHGVDVESLAQGLLPVDPVAALHTVSRDLTLSAPIQTQGCGMMTAWQMQTRLLSTVYRIAADVHGVDSTGRPLWPDESTSRIVDLWSRALRDVAAIRHSDDDARMRMADEASRVEWLLKWQLLQRWRQRGGLLWTDPRVQALALSWSDIDPKSSVFSRLRGAVENIVPDEGRAVLAAGHHAPEDTRACVRARLLSLFPDRVVAVSWSSVTLRLDDGGLASLDMSDPSEEWCRSRMRLLDADARVRGTDSVIRELVSGR
ncbi:depupylase/deamidase Dop [uncultured Bifidobacterium sp.]|uniref:depupylase/deamidase Dop n=1 Tax=uncultured Bifidobacterium sp. TaxID=165187 RepID=UPI002625BD5D|nr:depupylase/deamidase Dop [uncultured Bifidobacterium sp.]